jgi:branched-chain amino acid transport system ATP-binding protein
MVLTVRNAVAGYSREVTILNGLNLTAQDGIVTVILGPNGAGK